MLGINNECLPYSHWWFVLFPLQIAYWEGCDYRILCLFCLMRTEAAPKLSWKMTSQLWQRKLMLPKNPCEATFLHFPCNLNFKNLVFIVKKNHTRVWLLQVYCYNLKISKMNTLIKNNSDWNDFAEIMARKIMQKIYNYCIFQSYRGMWLFSLLVIVWLLTPIIDQ